jgi:hypothetical protein
VLKGGHRSVERRHRSVGRRAQKCVLVRMRILVHPWKWAQHKCSASSRVFACLGGWAGRVLSAHPCIPCSKSSSVLVEHGLVGWFGH